jgi:predicted kinase
MALRATDPTAVSDAGWEVYLAAKESFEPVTELDEWMHIQLDTDASTTVAGSVDAARAALHHRLHPD